MQNMDRRGFLKGAAVLGGAIAASGLAGCASEAAPQKTASTEGIVWEDEADVVILGTGGTGLAAAITMADEGLGSCIVLEAGSEEEAGGNSRVNGQLVMIPDSVEAAVAYQKAITAPYTVEDELLEAWAEGLYENRQWLEDVVGVELEQYTGADWTEFEAADQINQYTHDGHFGDGEFWALLKEKADEGDPHYYFNTRGIRLITDEAGQIIGVASEDGRNFKACKGVILGCGGFGANKDLMNTYYTSGFNNVISAGTPYAQGDGLRMCQAMGADLWHMNVFSGGTSYGVRNVAPDNDAFTAPLVFDYNTNHDFILLNRDGERFAYEETMFIVKNSMTKRNGTNVWRETPSDCFIVFGQNLFDVGSIVYTGGCAAKTPSLNPLMTNQEMLDAGIIVRSDTVEELAQALGQDAEKVKATLDNYNAICEGKTADPFGRGTDWDMFGQSEVKYEGASFGTTLAAFELQPLSAPYYSVSLRTSCTNTEGGPKRSAKGEVLHIDGTPIPRLYAGGELGNIIAYRYQCGSNFAEALSSGRLATRQCAALEPWEQAAE